MNDDARDYKSSALILKSILREHKYNTLKATVHLGTLNDTNITIKEEQTLKNVHLVLKPYMGLVEEHSADIKYIDKSQTDRKQSQDIVLTPKNFVALEDIVKKFNLNPEQLLGIKVYIDNSVKNYTNQQ